MSETIQISVPTITTNSRVRAWWLVAFYRYRLVACHVKPRLALFGRIRYMRHWYLEHRDKGKTGS
ncbi:MAG: hypothetical protein GY851_24315 [bacterium]|nr:hypothetical protein [bacterium]